MFIHRVLIAAALAFALPAAADQHVVTMTGHGEVAAMPDQAVVYAGVVTQARTAAEAVSSNAAAMNRVMAALKRINITGKAIQTTGFALVPEYAVQSQRRVMVGYEVSNSVSVTLDDVTRAGAVLDSVIGAGANQSAGVSFSIKNTTPLLAVARAQAAQDARTRAEAYAKALGVPLGHVISIQEGMSSFGGSNFPPIPDIAIQDKPTPIQASEQSVGATVTVVWSLK